MHDAELALSPATRACYNLPHERRRCPSEQALARRRRDQMALRRTAPLFLAILVVVTACNIGSSGDYLARIKSAGVIKVSTDPAYPPQSFLNEDTNELRGLRHRRRQGDRRATGRRRPVRDAELRRRRGRRMVEPLGHQRRIGDHHAERAKRSWTSPSPTTTRRPRWPPWRAVDITTARGPRRRHHLRRRVDDVSVLAGGDARAPDDAGDRRRPCRRARGRRPSPTDINCAEAWRDGRTDFEGWLSSITTVDGAIDGWLAVVPVGDPVFYEAPRRRLRQGGRRTTTRSWPRSIGSSARCTTTAR